MKVLHRGGAARRFPPGTLPARVVQQLIRDTRLLDANPRHAPHLWITDVRNSGVPQGGGESAPRAVGRLVQDLHDAHTRHDARHTAFAG